jgi:hypothetical protein
MWSQGKRITAVLVPKSGRSRPAEVGQLLSIHHFGQFWEVVMVEGTRQTEPVRPSADGRASELAAL